MNRGSSNARRALTVAACVLAVGLPSRVGLASAARASYSNTVALVAVAIAAADAAGTWRRLKACAAPGCGQAFYDAAAAGAPTRCAEHSAG